MADDAVILTWRQRRFVTEYVKDFNATQAAIRAGYSEKTAYRMGYENLNKPQIKAALAELRDAAWDAEAMSAKETVAEMSRIGRANMADYLFITEAGDPYTNLAGVPRHLMAAIKTAEIEDFIDRRERDAEGNVIVRDVRRVKIGLHDKKGALDSMMKLHKLLTDKVEVSVSEDFAALMVAADKRTST